MNSAGLISVGLIGAGRMGSFHAETLARRLPGTRLAAYGPAGLAAGCVRYDQDLFRDAYIAELKDE